MSADENKHDRLFQFKIELASPSPSLYANALQQVALTVTAEVHPGEEGFTEGEAASLSIGWRDDRGEYRRLPFNDDGLHPWFVTTDRNGYDFIPAADIDVLTEQSAHADSLLQPRVRKTLYVSSRAIEQKIELYATIGLTAGEGERDYYSDGDDFDSMVELSTLRAIPLQPGNFDFVEHVRRDNGDLSVYEYTLAVAGGTAPALRIVQANMAPAGMIKWADRNQSERRASHVGFAPPRSRTYLYNTAIVLGPNFRPEPTVQWPVGDHVTLIIEGGNTIPYHSASELEQGGPCVLRLHDNFGNEHEVTISFDPENRFQLLLG
ncbi:hypothetical protein [Pseudomonas shirazensis]|uniref:hypothetical protein n=1 Tax=Pseudomonas shirazensis TaxID=2745494 RepID=UPI003D2B6CCA